MTDLAHRPEMAPGAEPLPRVSADGPMRKTAAALGLVSIGLGIGEILAPRAVSRLIGTTRHPRLMRLMGVRKLAAGVGLLTLERPAGWLWAHAGGDLLDLAGVLKSGDPGRRRARRVGAALAAVGGVTALEAVLAQRWKAASRASEPVLRFSASVAINRSPRECYLYWRNLENLPRFLKRVKSVQACEDGRLHWIARGPAGKEIAWDSEIVEDIPEQRIAWHSHGGPFVPDSGSVRFESIRGGEGAIARLHVTYDFPLRTGRAAVRAFLGRDPGLRLRANLMRFKQMVETGEIATTEGQPAGRRSGVTWLDRLARV